MVTKLNRDDAFKRGESVVKQAQDTQKNFHEETRNNLSFIFGIAALAGAAEVVSSLFQNQGIDTSLLLQSSAVIFTMASIMYVPNKVKSLHQDNIIEHMKKDLRTLEKDTNIEEVNNYNYWTVENEVIAQGKNKFGSYNLKLAFDLVKSKEFISAFIIPLATIGFVQFKSLPDTDLIRHEERDFIEEEQKQAIQPSPYP